MSNETLERMRQLRSVFYNGTISPEERKELFQHYRHLCSRGVVNEMIIRNFLLLTGPKTGLPFFKK